MQSGGSYCFLQVSSWLRPRAGRRQGFLCAVNFLLFFLALGCINLAARPSFAQSASDNTDTIRGVVLNSVTREPIARALVYCPDNRFATLTNSEGRFEFTVTKPESAGQGGSDSNTPSNGPVSIALSNRPYALLARKPGFMSDPNNPSPNLQNAGVKDLTLTLIPESLIVGTVTLPTSEAPDSITLQIFRQQVEDGRAHWVPAGGTQSTADGQFRFADLPAGTYKLLTRELLDNDPLDNDPLDNDPLTADPLTPERRRTLYGYPPVYYQNASDFGSASGIRLAAGQTQTANLSLVKQAYYRVKVPVIFPASVEAGEGAASPHNGINLEVYANGHSGPGFSLGYNNLHGAIEGLLPNGTYTIEATSGGLSGVGMIAIKGAPIGGSSIGGPSIALLPSASIAINVKEEFTSADNTGPMTWNINGRTRTIRGPRRYLNVTLEPADDFRTGRRGSLRDPTTADDALVMEGVPAGSYWVRVQSSRGYPASIRSGNLDLEHQPLVVGVGGAPSAIEIAMRDDTAEITGTVEGVPPPQGDGGAGGGISGWNASATAAEPPAHIYCIPLPDSSGQFTEIWVSPDGSFVSQGLAPGAYRLLAFDREQPDLEYRNPEAMRAYDSKGPVVRVAGGQKERVQLQLISTGNSASEP